MKTAKLTQNIILVSIMSLALVFLPSCTKDEPAEDTETREQTTNDGQAEKPAEGTEELAEETADAEGTTEESSGDAPAGMIPLPIELPPAVFTGTPTNIKVDNLEKPLGEPRPTFYVPEGTTNVAKGQPVTSSDSFPIIGTLDQITDGDARATDGSWVELGPFEQHVQVDLGAPKELYAILLWHYHKQPRVYFDVVVQTADDPDFVTNVKTLFNNDIDNSLGLGTGSDMHYVETSEGKLIEAKGTKARYVRCYSNGSNANDMNHYIEVAVFGKSAE